jgi:transmembrane sensor
VRLEPVTDALEEEAAAWVVALHHPDQSSEPTERKAQAVRWIQQSAAHVAAFMHADDTYCRLERLDSEHRIDVEELVRRHHASSVDLVRAVEGTRHRFRLRPALAASFALAASVALVWIVYTGAHTISTSIGEQRVVQLPDGSTMEMNTNSQVKVDFSPNARRVWMKRGEALFSVEHDPARPFFVITPSATVRAIGTQFDVYDRTDQSTTVTVIEGTVRLAAEPQADTSVRSEVPVNSQTAPVDKSNGDAISLTAGQQAVIENKRISKSNDANAPDVIAWKDRLLVFHAKALADVAAEFNRYNTRKIVIRDDVIGSRPMSGTYSIDRPQILVMYLQEDIALSVTVQHNNWVIQKRAD